MTPAQFQTVLKALLIIVDLVIMLNKLNVIGARGSSKHQEARELALSLKEELENMKKEIEVEN